MQFHRDTSAGISAATVSAALYAPLTRQITFPTSSATSSAPSGASVTPTGRPVLARREGECNDSIGMADVEGVPDQRHAERLAHSLQKDFLDLGRAVAIRVAQPRDPVRGYVGRRDVLKEQCIPVVFAPGYDASAVPETYIFWSQAWG